MDDDTTMQDPLEEKLPDDQNPLTDPDMDGDDLSEEEKETPEKKDEEETW